jgi:hypothetical protein
VSYVVKNSPYPEVILRPRLEAENEAKPKEVEGHVVIAQESGSGFRKKRKLVKTII